MRLILIGPIYPYRGGIARHTHMLYKAFLDRGHETNLISFKRQYPKFLYPGKTDIDPSSKRLTFQVNYLLDPINIWTWRSTHKYINRTFPDVVIFQYWTTFMAPCNYFLATKLSKQEIPTIFIIHNLIPHETNYFDKYLSKFVLQKGDYHVVQSLNEKIKLLKLIPQVNPIYYPHPRYTDFLKHKIEKNLAREKLGLDINDFVFLAFGIIRPYKGLKNVIAALKVLKDQDIKPKLIIAGEFWEKKSEYIKIINGFGLSNQVIIIDKYIPDNEVGILFSSADAYIAAYTKGSQSGAVRIAVCYDLPILLSQSIIDSVEETYKCILVNPEDIRDMACGIKSIIKLKNEKYFYDNELSYTWDGMAKSIEKIMTEIHK